MKIEIVQELRPCKFSISGQNCEGWSNGSFHCFGNVNGEMKRIVENEHGAVFTVKPFLIRFLDSEAKFKEYCFEENPN